ncbi:hypothetical protein [Streptomyces sp. NPDC002088]|uniref:hypothetical protein n=1 Tax=Streptomyces sp. NPDC002088 TaxID=3154665 RepID=UPI003325230F
MPETHDVGPFFAHTVNLKPGAPFLHTAPTDEIEPPYRQSNSTVIKIWPGKGIVLGRWRNTWRSESDALYTAVQGYGNAMSTDAIRDRAHRFDEDLDELVI